MPAPPTARKTARVTHSTSTTSGGGMPPIATNIPKDLIFQAQIDLRNDALWTVRPSVRQTLAWYLQIYENSNYLTEVDLTKLHNIVRYNDSRRARTPYNPALVFTPRVPADVTPPEPELDEEVEPGPDASSSDVKHYLGFNPPLPASYIGQGWGFVGGAIVDRFRKIFDDFPKPIAADGRKQPLWWFQDILAWTAKHLDDIERARTRRLRTHDTHTKHAQVAELQARIAELEAQLGAST